MKTVVFSPMSCIRSRLFLVGCTTFWFVAQTTRATPAEELRILKKMDGIMLESLEYRQANIVDVINELSDLSRECDEIEPDPKKKGINFVLDIDSKQADGIEDDPWAIGSGGGAFIDIPAISIKARYVSLKTALDVIMGEAGLEYRVVGNLVKISRKNASSPEGTGAEHPLLSAKSIQIVKSFDIKKVRNPAQWKWYCYEPGKAILSGRPVETTKLGFKREPKTGPVVLLFDSGSGTLQWKWIAAPPAKLFADKDSVNLGELCFGPDPLAENVWCRLNPDWDHRFKISSRLLSTEVYGGDVTLLEKAMEWVQDEWEYNKTPEFSKHLSEYNRQTNQLTKIELELATIDERMSMLGSELRTAEDNDRRMRSSGRIEYSGAAGYSSPRTRSLRTERTKLSAKRSKLQEEFDSLLAKNKKTTATLNGIVSDYKKTRNKAPLEAAVRKMELTVSVVKKGETSR